MSRAGTILSLTLLSGCVLVGPDHQTPTTELSTAFANAGQPGLSMAPVPTRWWQGFKDQELERLVDLALAGNHDVRIASARLREARALRDETVFDRYPTVTVDASYANEQQSTTALQGFPSGDRDRALYNAGFDAFWELDIFGRVRRSVEASAAEVEAFEASWRDVLVSLIAEVARNYFELRGTQHQLAVARRNADNQRQTLDLTIVRLEDGIGTVLDVARARAQLDATRASIPPLEAAIRRAMHRLSVLMGSRPESLMATLEQPAPLPQPPKLVALGRPEDLLRRRPDVLVAERNLAAATARIGVATADLFPRVTFVGSIALEASTFTGLGGAGSNSYSFGPSIRWAALDLGRVRARIRQADARAEASLAQYELTVLRALEETENALVELGRQQARRDSLRTSAEASEEAAGLARQRFEEGAADFLTVLDAERTLLEAQDRFARSGTDTATASVAVYKALGGGWEVTVKRTRLGG
ncbi:MAG: efflux transporter outer membrane subunit [Gammaproteobacteria bacterium]